MVYVSLGFTYSLPPKSNTSKYIAEASKPSKGKGKKAANAPKAPTSLILKAISSKTPRWTHLVQPLSHQCSYTKYSLHTFLSLSSFLDCFLRRKLERKIAREIPPLSENGSIFSSYWVISTAAAEALSIARSYQTAFRNLDMVSHDYQWLHSEGNERFKAAQEGSSAKRKIQKPLELDNEQS